MIGLHAVQVVGQLFSVPQSRKRKRYLESLEAGMDLTGSFGPQVIDSPTIPRVSLSTSQIRNLRLSVFAPCP